MDEKEGTQAIFGQQGGTCAEIGEMPNWPAYAKAIQQSTKHVAQKKNGKHAKTQSLVDG